MDNTDIVPVVDKMPEVKHARMNRLDDSLFSKELAPHYMQLATKLASSELVPKSFRGKPQDLFICWEMGYQIGLTPSQSMQCIAVINGKPAMWGDDMLALVMVHKDFIDVIENPIIKNEMIVGYNCIVKRKGRADKENIFTLDMAKKAGLLAKGGVWTQYPERMLKLRARGFALRDAFPDALKGIKSREEVEDYIDPEYETVQYKGSRTELLKKDILNKQGVNDVELDSRSIFADEIKPISQTNEESEQLHPETQDSQSLSQLHLEIKRLIEEKQFIGDRFSKALRYYEVGSVEELNLESANHFIGKLKLL